MARVASWNKKAIRQIATPAPNILNTKVVTFSSSYMKFVTKIANGWIMTTASMVSAKTIAVHSISPTIHFINAITIRSFKVFRTNAIKYYNIFIILCRLINTTHLG